MSGSHLSVPVCDFRFPIFIEQQTIRFSSLPSDFWSVTFCQNFFRFFRRHTFVESLVAHHDRGGAATGQAFDELDRELAVLRRLRAMLVGIQAKLVAELMVQLVRSTQGTA